MKKRPVWFASGNLISEDRLKINTREKYLDLVNTMERGDFIVFKNTRNKSSEIPFETHGKLVSVMEIRGFGRIKKKPTGEKNIDIEWERINCSKEWYLFTFIKNLYKVDGESKNWMYQELLKFIFNDQPQDIARFINEPYWKRRYSPGNEYCYQCEIFEVLKGLGGEGTLSQIQEEIKERHQLEDIKNNENWEAEVYRTLQKFSSDSKSFLGREDLYYRKRDT